MNTQSYRESPLRSADRKTGSLPIFAQLSESGLLDQIAPPAAKLLDSVSIGNCTNSVMAVTIDCDLMLCDQHFLTAWS